MLYIYTEYEDMFSAIQKKKQYNEDVINTKPPCVIAGNKIKTKQALII